MARWMRAVGRGARRRCPRCGQGKLFYRWNRVHDHCARCGLTFLPDAGGPWVFLLVLDRAVFIFPPIVVIYFGFLPSSVPLIVLTFVALVAVILYTSPHRYGACIALDVLTRGETIGGDDAPRSIGYPSAPDSPDASTTEE